jgi:hypothetical protein
MSRKADPREKGKEPPRGQTTLGPGPRLLLGGVELPTNTTTEAPHEGGTASTENPGLRVLARMIARTMLSEGLTHGEVPVSLNDETKSG